LLAPLALVASAVALFAVVTSGGGGGGTASSTEAPTATATATASPERRKRARRARTPAAKAKTYTVKAGDTPSSIAQALGVDLDALLAANPDADPSSLTVGQKLKLP
jgi:LysM repeat protein